MKYFLILFCMCLTVSVVAQDTSEITQEQKEEIKRMVKSDIESLQLSEDQIEPYRESARRHLDQLMALRNSDSPRRVKFREAKKIRDSRNSEMKELLSEAQFQTYLEIQERRKEEMKERRKNQ